jgi:hypothetical protein
MPAKKFRFVSPGIQIKEIDKSQLPRLPNAIGPVVVGRTMRGPGMVPVTVGSYEEFVEKFGAPDRGAGSDDVWRNGNTTSPTYASYAAEAYLKNSSPLTVVRLLGTEDAAATDAGAAGWTTTNPGADIDAASNGGAYGLFIMPKATDAVPVTGALAAIFYLDDASLKLVGDGPNGASVTHDSTLVKSVGSDFEFRMKILKNGTEIEKGDVTFNFNPSSAKYIRKVLNTNPTLANDKVTPEESVQPYWLGETFETFLKEVIPTETGAAAVAGEAFAFIAALEDSSTNHADFQSLESTPGMSGWVIGQDLNSVNSNFEAKQMPKLFRVVAGESDTGSDWEQNNVKVSIFDIKYSDSLFDKFGTFSLAVRKIDDTDSNPKFLEVFTGLNLNPSSPNYVAARIGDRRLEWDDSEKRHKEIGDYPNLSKYIRVEMNQIAEQGGLEPDLLPFGFTGPTRFKTITVNSGSMPSGMLKVGTANTPHASGSYVDTDGLNLTASLEFPRLPMIVSSSEAGALDFKQAFFGMMPTVGGTDKLNEDVRDILRIKPSGVDSHKEGTAAEYSFVFSLDDVIVEDDKSSSRWVEGSRKAGDSLTAESGSYQHILDFGHDRFTMPLFGGFDGLDIKEREPFRNSLMEEDGRDTRKTNYAMNSLMRAMESVKDPEVLEMNLLVLPGITNRAVTKFAIDVCEQRADSLAIIDLEDGYLPASENADAERLRLGSASETVRSVKGRNLNTSFGCAYYPWVKVLDSESGQPLWMPPSVVALGTMALSQENSEVWFAPAGFNRGGLSLGSSGLDVVGVREKLTSKQRDSLYEVNVNPIASFPSEGIVIFGQKTLQAVPSALDRINVRRLVLFIKKEISRIAADLLFEPNVQATWDRFKGRAEPLLEGVRSGFGISEYKLVLDETTTTPEEIDRNMMYAKLFIKPVYAIEFIGVDFIITNTGASFEDL